MVTEEGTCRGLRAQVADLSEALQSVRGLVRPGQLVLVGDGKDGTQHYFLNRATGELNSLSDYGTNYLIKLYVVPQNVSPFGRPVAPLDAGSHKTTRSAA